uniref:Uncharacterized protein n=1 Tax=Arundo donax TaxID=35708 RepID=A0A0A9AYT2_ARUDO
MQPVGDNLTRLSSSDPTRIVP